MPDGMIDPTCIERLESLGGRALKVKLIDMFIERSPVSVRNIKQSILDKNADAIEQIAHSLISSAGNLGGTALSQLAGELESAAIKKDFKQIDLLCVRLFEALHEFEIFLKRQKDLV